MSLIADRELALVEVPPPFGRSEPDPEIQDVLRRSHGLNVGLRYLDGAFNYDSKAAGEFIPAGLASRVVWLDAFVTNPDRTHRNPNILVWQRTPWLIDHGAALYAHHDWGSLDDARLHTAFGLIRDHVLLSRIEDLARTDQAAVAALTQEVIGNAVAVVPDALLEPEPGGETPARARGRYIDYLVGRIDGPRAFVGAAIEAHDRLLQERPRAVPPRR